jgi:hypothetical protein
VLRPGRVEGRAPAALVVLSQLEVVRRGVPIAYISRQLGHSSIQVTVDLYGHFIPGADRHHVEGLAEAIEEAATGQNATPAQPVLPVKQQPTA